MFEIKVRPVLARLIILWLCSLCVYLGNDTFNEYFFCLVIASFVRG